MLSCMFPLNKSEILYGVWRGMLSSNRKCAQVVSSGEHSPWGLLT